MSSSETDAVQESLREAVRLFEACEYHEAHEVLDELWEATHGEDADFFKGLIQACIAMHHYRRDNLEGAAKLYSGHRRYLAAYLPRHRGVDVEAFLAEMQRVLQPVVRAAPGAAPRFEAASAPRLRVAPDSAEGN